MHAIKKFVVVFFTVVIAVGLVSALVIGGMLIKYMSEVSDIEVSDIALNLTSTVYCYDENGNEVEVQRLYGQENRMWVDSDQIPENLKNAFVAIEDERYYSHNGVDLPRTIRATFNYLFKDSTSFGGSTITQQLVKNITNEKDVTPARKVKEIARAMKLDKELGKDKVLEMYLNIIYLAKNCNGVQAASHKYFAKDVSELTLAECASIAGITQNPAKYDPLRNPENNKERQMVVLGKMLELEMITQEEYDEAAAQELVFQSDEITSNDDVINSYFVDHVINEVINDLVEQKGYSQKVASNLIYMGGLKIYMTMDPTVQDVVEEVYEDESNFPDNAPANPKVKDSEEYPQSAICIIDPYTGQIKGLAGGIGEKTQNRILNRATQSKRQPGSAIKPVSVYAPALELGLISPGSVVVDEAIDIDGWQPKNQYSGFRGAMTIREAVNRSSNIPAVKVLQEVGLDYSFSFMKNKLGMDSLVESKEVNGKVYTDKTYPSLALGGLTDGITVEEITAAYAPFINKGIYNEPYAYTKVLDSEGNVILENTSTNERAMSEQTAYLMSYLLGSVVESGTGTLAQLDGGMQAYGKTGTTDSDYDRWFVGYTPYYVAGVWYGYDTQASVDFLSSNPCARVWKTVMDKLHEDKEPVDLEATSGCTTEEICVYSGKLASQFCSQIEDAKVSSELFAPNMAPTDYCHLHDETSLPGADQPPETTEEPAVPPEATGDPNQPGTEPSPSPSPSEPPAESPEPSPSEPPAESPEPSPSESPESSPSPSPSPEPTPDESESGG